MDREYQGCIYDRPGHVRRSELDLTRTELAQIVAQLPSTPMVLDHELDLYAGVVTRAWQDPRTGSAYVGFCLDPHSENGQVAYRRIKDQKVRGLSLSHWPSTLKPREVTICSRGARPNTGIINASINSGKPTSIPADVRVIPAPAMADLVAPMSVDSTETPKDATATAAAKEEKKETATAAAVATEDALLAKYFDTPTASTTGSSSEATPMDTDTMAEFQAFQQFKAQQKAAVTAAATKEPERGTKRPADDSGMDPQILNRLRELEETNKQIKQQSEAVQRQLVDAKLDKYLGRLKANGQIPNTDQGRKGVTKLVEDMRNNPEAIKILDGLLAVTQKRARTSLPSSSSKAEAKTGTSGADMSTEERAKALLTMKRSGGQQLPAAMTTGGGAAATAAQNVPSMISLSSGKEVPVNASFESHLQSKGYDRLVATQLARMTAYEPYTTNRCYPMDAEGKLWTMDRDFKPRARAVPHAS